MLDQANALREMVGQPDAAATPPSPPTPLRLADGADPVTHAPRLAQSIAITSGKGGVGKSTVSVNLAVQLARLGRRVVLLDADLGTANVDVMCNLAPRGTLAHVVSGRLGFDDIALDAPGGFRVIPGASGLAHIAALSRRQLDRLAIQMRQLETGCDVILIDTGAGVGPSVLAFCAAAERMLVVTTPEPTAVTDAYALLKTVHGPGSPSRPTPGLPERPETHLLINQCRDAAEGREVYGRIAGVCKHFLDFAPRSAGHIVLDPRVQKAVRSRQPFTLEAPNTAAAKCLHQLAHRLDRDATDPRERAGGVLHRLSRWLYR